MAEQNKNSPPGPPPGERSYRHLLKSRIQRLRVARPREAACPGASQAWQGRRRAAPLSCGQLHAAAVVKAAVVAELERRWRQQEGAFGDEQTRAVTYVALRARSVAVRSSCNTPGSASPSTLCFNALAWWTCRRAMACRAEAACPAAL